MERLSKKYAELVRQLKSCLFTVIWPELAGNAATVIQLLDDRLAYYEDLEEQGRLVVLPEVKEKDRKAFVDGLYDYFQEAKVYDPSVGIWGMTDGEALLADALMSALNREEAEEALGKEGEEVENRNTESI